VNRQTMQQITRFGTKASLALAVVSALSLPLCAQAGSFQLPTTNAAGWARAGAGGSLFPDDVTAAYNNPAAMAFFDAPMIQVTGTGIRPSSEFHGEFRDEQGNPTTGNNPNGFARFIPFPDIAWALPVTDRLVIGGSVTVPYGLVSKYNPTWEGRYFGTYTSLKSIAASLSAGFKVNDEFSMGAGVEVQRTYGQLNTDLDPYGTAAALFHAPILGAPQSGDVQLNVDVKKQYAYGYFGGFEWKPTQQDSIDINYHSRVKQTLSGNYKLYGSPASIGLIQLAPQFNGLLPPGSAPLPALNPDGGPASTSLDTPAFAGADWLHKFNDQFSMAASVNWTDWSNFNSLTLMSVGQTLVSLPQRYKDTFSYSIGGACRPRLRRDADKHHQPRSAYSRRRTPHRGRWRRLSGNPADLDRPRLPAPVCRQNDGKSDQSYRLGRWHHGRVFQRQWQRGQPHGYLRVQVSVRRYDQKEGPRERPFFLVSVMAASFTLRVTQSITLNQSPHACAVWKTTPTHVVTGRRPIQARR